MSTCYKVKITDVISESLDGEMIIINLKTGTYHNLNESAATIWNYLIKGVDVDTLCSAIQGDNTDVKASLLTLIEDLLSHELIEKIPKISTPIVEAIQMSPLGFACESYSDMKELLGLDPIHEVDEGVGWPNMKQ